MEANNGYKAGDVVLVMLGNTNLESLGVVKYACEYYAEVKLLEPFGYYSVGDVKTVDNNSLSRPKFVRWKRHTPETCPPAGALRVNRQVGPSVKPYEVMPYMVTPEGVYTPVMDGEPDNEGNFRAYWKLHAFGYAVMLFEHTTGDGIWLPFGRPVVEKGDTVN
jgi:hypothetical protein